MAEEIKRAALKKALGAMGPESLAVRLGSPVSLLQAWVTGQATMPERTFAMLADILAAIDDTLPNPKA